jgi:hypothetical protein
LNRPQPASIEPTRNPSGPFPVGVTCGTEQHRRSKEQHQPEAQVEKSVLRILCQKPPDRSWSAVPIITNQMMPPQDLMQNDAVREAAEPCAQDDA